MPVGQRANTPVILGLLDAFVNVPAVHAHLLASGWTRIVDFLDLHAAQSAALGDRHWLTDRLFYRKHRASIRTVDALWADDQSRNHYRLNLRFRVTGDDTLLPLPDPDHQYFPIDLPPWPKPLRMVDCRACDGDTLRRLRSLKLSVTAVALFEPDSSNFARLALEAETLSESGVSALAWPCGVAARTAMVCFRADQCAASAISAEGDRTVTCVALDEALPGFASNFFKMDVEGGELDALYCARRLIERSCPGLAIGVYHRPADFWPIPQSLAA